MPKAYLLVQIMILRGGVLNVTNQSQDVFLFSYINKSESVDVPAELIDNGVFYEIPSLNHGKKLLVIEDQNPWVENRSGYSYGHIRKDILLLKKGKAQNQTIMPYNNEYSSPKCKVYDVEYSRLFINNLIFNREPNSNFKTYLCSIRGTDNVCIENVSIYTPQSNLVEDMAINIVDCTNVNLDNVAINGTYSRTDYSGYGICMNTIWKFTANRLTAHANWGIFGDNNINVVNIYNSDINRFDIHYYGRDVYFRKVYFSGLYDQFSSVFGSIIFDNCIFDNFTPIVYEYTYNTYNNHEVLFKDCTHKLSSRRNYLIFAGILSDERNKRNELSEKYWPKLTINNMRIEVPQDVGNYYVYCVRNEDVKNAKLDHILDVTINGMDFYYIEGAKPINVNLSNVSVSTVEAFNINIKDLNIFTKQEEKELGNKGNLYINITGNNKVSSVNVSHSMISNYSFFNNK